MKISRELFLVGQSKHLETFNISAGLCRKRLIHKIISVWGVGTNLKNSEEWKKSPELI